MENSIYNKKSRFSDNLLNFFIQFSTLISIVLLVVIIGYICYRGIPHFSFDYLINTTSILNKTVGILPNIINTLYNCCHFINCRTYQHWWSNLFK